MLPTARTRAAAVSPAGFLGGGGAATGAPAQVEDEGDEEQEEGEEEEGVADVVGMGEVRVEG